MPKHRLAFSKADTAKFISHLDLMRTFQRSFLRAGIAIKHTEGFNPHAFVSIPLPLSVGFSSGCEVLECQVQDTPLDQVPAKMNAALPAGITVQRCYEAVRPVKELCYVNYIVTLEYENGAPFGAETAIRDLLSRESLVVTKKSKKAKSGQTQLDLIPLIQRVDYEGRRDAVVLDMVLRAKDPGLNPALLLWAFVMMCAVGVVLEPLLALLPELQINVGRGFWTILSLVLFAPVFEELICRGVVLGSLRSRYGVTIAWLVSSLFFGILHGQPVQVVNAFVVGLVLGYVYIATDSLWAAMILHALNNAVAYLMLVTGHANTLLIDLIPGRTLYVAVYVVALAVLVVSGYMMWRALRRMKEAEKNRAGA